MNRGYTKRWRKKRDKGYHQDPLLWVMMDYFIDYANYKEFGFTSIEILETLIVEIIILLNAQVRRGVDGNTLKTLFSSYNVIEQHNNEKQGTQMPSLSV